MYSLTLLYFELEYDVSINLIYFFKTIEGKEKKNKSLSKIVGRDYAHKIIGSEHNVYENAKGVVLL